MGEFNGRVRNEADVEQETDVPRSRLVTCASVVTRTILLAFDLRTVEYCAVYYFPLPGYIVTDVNHLL